MDALTALHGADTSTLTELTHVTLRAEQRTRDGRPVPKGSSGTVVEVLGQGQAYMVEFARPFQALLTVQASDVAAIEG